jgi:hypothetical protein
VTVVLTSPALEVEITEERGADIRQIVDQATGMKFLAESPTAPGHPGRVPGDSMMQWLNGYPGGWQFLCPNADDARVHDGIEQGYHGEAALVDWVASNLTESSCDFTTSLVTAPLELHRRVTVSGRVVEVTDSVTNLSAREVSVQLVQHPAFGPDFLGEGSYLELDAGVLISDARGPGSLLAADAVTSPSVLPEGPAAGSVAIPAEGSGHAIFAAFAELGSAAAIFVSPSSGVAARLEWDIAVYPYAWFWVEANSPGGWPWFGRMYAAAVEPANVLPGRGSVAGYTRGSDGTAIAGSATLTSTTRLSLVPHLAQPSE